MGALKSQRINQHHQVVPKKNASPKNWEIHQHRSSCISRYTKNKCVASLQIRGCHSIGFLESTTLSKSCINFKYLSLFACLCMEPFVVSSTFVKCDKSVPWPMRASFTAELDEASWLRLIRLSKAIVCYTCIFMATRFENFKSQYCRFLTHISRKTTDLTLKSITFNNQKSQTLQLSSSLFLDVATKIST